jgi:hypothetical protein
MQVQYLRVTLRSIFTATLRAATCRTRSSWRWNIYRDTEYTRKVQIDTMPVWGGSALWFAVGGGVVFRVYTVRLGYAGLRIERVPRRGAERFWITLCQRLVILLLLYKSRLWWLRSSFLVSC